MFGGVEVVRWLARKGLGGAASVGGDSIALSYGAMVVAGSMLGFGALVGLGSSHHSLGSVDAGPMATEAPASETHGGNSEPAHSVAADPPAAPEAAPAETADAVDQEAARAAVRERFTSHFLARFLSTDCDKNRHSENGVQFGSQSYSEFTDSNRSRYVVGEYHFAADGFSLVVDEANHLDFTLADDTLTMTRVMIDGVIVPASPALKWTTCHSDIHEMPLEPPKVVRYDASDGLRLALSANDLEAVTHYLALGGYVPSNEFDGVVKAAHLEGPISAPIRITSRLNEDDALHRQAAADALAAKQRAEEARHKAEAANKPKPPPKAGPKPKEGGGH